MLEDLVFVIQQGLLFPVSHTEPEHPFPKGRCFSVAARANFLVNYILPHHLDTRVSKIHLMSKTTLTAMAGSIPKGLYYQSWVKCVGILQVYKT